MKCVNFNTGMFDMYIDNHKPDSTGLDGNTVSQKSKAVPTC
jgi:hypothetical protein